MANSIQSILFIGLLLVLISCKNAESNHDSVPHQTSSKVDVPEFQSFIDSTGLVGAILIYDLQKDTYYSNDFIWANSGHLPASTFKVPNSIIGLETGVVENDSTLFKWDGQKRRIKNWEQDLIFKQAFHYSCYPCYQEIARAVGVDTMIAYLEKLNYPGMVVDSNTLDRFWLESDESKINQFQQIDFLKRIYLRALPISNRTDSIMRNMIVIEQNDQYTLSGKTGWSILNGKNNGWFVGYLEIEKSTWFFATNVSPAEGFDMKRFPKIRKEVTLDAFKALDILE